jgi:hypothetical protein
MYLYTMPYTQHIVQLYKYYVNNNPQASSAKVFYPSCVLSLHYRHYILEKYERKQRS